MKRFLSIAMALCIGLTMSLDANAKRFGGGKSAGAAPTHQTSQMAPSSPGVGGAAATAGAAGAAGAAAKAGGASRWLGPLAGIAAGGLLASMFMGDGFQGMQIMDFLIMGLIGRLNASLGLTSIIVTHHVHETLPIADHAIVIANGRIVFQGTPAELEASTDPLVRQFLRGEPDGPIAFDRGDLARTEAAR